MIRTPFEVPRGSLLAHALHARMQTLHAMYDIEHGHVEQCATASRCILHMSWAGVADEPVLSRQTLKENAKCSSCAILTCDCLVGCGSAVRGGAVEPVLALRGMHALASQRSAGDLLTPV